ncbi:unnamed protein product [Toxocara canis]|uniref:Transposase n=1 Tax=Toxocara canis TaxID=6265 RepID=A0A183V3Q1_TOXCA|nr:unnamed protein product [Toxocara canis]
MYKTHIHFQTRHNRRVYLLVKAATATSTEAWRMPEYELCAEGLFKWTPTYEYRDIERRSSLGSNMGSLKNAA